MTPGNAGFGKGAGGGGVSPGALATSFATGSGQKAEISVAVSGLADSPTLLMSLWFLRPTGAASFPILNAGGGGFLWDLIPATVGTLFTRLDNTNSDVYDSTNSTGLTIADTWVHALYAYNRSTGARQRYINDTDKGSDTSGPTGFDLKLTAAALQLPPTGDTTTGLSEVYISTDFLDITVEANRRKFIDALGKPVSLGADGSTPTGTQPEIFAADGNIGNNLGSGGNATVTGTPTEIAGPGA
mgnify:CR=1 FL=1